MKLIFIPTLALAFSSAVKAAECYFQGGSTRCVTKEGALRFRDAFCNEQWGNDYTSTIFKDTKGQLARISHDGPFDNQQQCWDATQDIINTCYGYRDGGTWTVNRFTANVNFCYTY